MLDDFQAPDENNAEQAAMPYAEDETGTALTEIERVVQKHEQRLISIDGVIGVGIQNDAVGNPIIVIYVRDAGVRKLLPAQLEGWAVRIEVTGEISALDDLS